MVAALEFTEYQESLCTGCGSPRAESFDPAGPVYAVEALRCRACSARAVVAREFGEDDHADLDGMFFAVEPLDRARAEAEAADWAAAASWRSNVAVVPGRADEWGGL